MHQVDTEELLEHFLENITSFPWRIGELSYDQKSTQISFSFNAIEMKDNLLKAARKVWSSFWETFSLAAIIVYANNINSPGCEIGSSIFEPRCFRCTNI